MLVLDTLPCFGCLSANIFIYEWFWIIANQTVWWWQLFGEAFQFHFFTIKALVSMCLLRNILWISIYDRRCHNWRTLHQDIRQLLGLGQSSLSLDKWDTLEWQRAAAGGSATTGVWLTASLCKTWASHLKCFHVDVILIMITIFICLMVLMMYLAIEYI